MRIMFRVCVVLMIVASCAESTYQIKGGPNSESFDSSKKIRQRRSVASMLVGVKAFRQLIAEATFVPSKHGQYHNKFVKYGDINTAYRDFYATNPQSVSEEGYKGVKILRGIVGDREILLRDPTNAPGASKPDGVIYIDLIDTKAKSTKPQHRMNKTKGRYDRIVYINKKAS